MEESLPQAPVGTQETAPAPTKPDSAPFPPDVPGEMYRTEYNIFCRAWVGTEYTGYATIDAATGWPATSEVYTAHTTEFLSKWVKNGS